MASIPSFYKDRSVFITGATGFMGKALLEKLLRSCPELKNIYILIRPKRGKDVGERLDDLLSSKIFGTLKEKQPHFRRKIIPVTGDIQHDNLGISRDDEHDIIQHVSIVFHSAATIKFDEELKLAVEMNVHAVYKVIKLCKKLKDLKAFVHVSTAYSNCNLTNIEEKVYDPPLHPSKILDAVDWLDNDSINSLTTKIVGERPNTYTYTKAIAECLVHEECQSIPAAIFRPSIVCASLNDPVPGWVDNFSALSGVISAIGTGVMRVVTADSNAVADLVPVDVAVHMMIATAWYTANQRHDGVQVYHCITGTANPIKWGDVVKYVLKYTHKHPSNMMKRVPSLITTKYQFVYDMVQLVVQAIPFYFMDACLKCTGQKPVFGNLHSRLNKRVTDLTYFSTREWSFTNSKAFNILNSMNSEDLKIFNFNPHSIDWPKYIDAYWLGIKLYALRENTKETHVAKRTLTRLKRMNLVFNVIVVIVLWRFVIRRFAWRKFARKLFKR